MADYPSGTSVHMWGVLELIALLTRGSHDEAVCNTQAHNELVLHTFNCEGHSLTKATVWCWKV